MHTVGSVLLEQLLNADHGGQSGPAPRLRPRARRPSSSTTGPSTCKRSWAMCRSRRAYYYCGQCPEDRGRGVIPKDQELDVVGTSFSPGLRRLMARVGAQEPFDAARRDLAEVAGVVVRDQGAGAHQRGGWGRRRGGQRSRTRGPAHRHGATKSRNAPASISRWMAPACRWCPKRRRAARAKGRTGRPKPARRSSAVSSRSSTLTRRAGPCAIPMSTTYVGAIETAEQFGPRLHAEAVRRGLTRGHHGHCSR